jgi:hypothetical protein
VRGVSPAWVPRWVPGPTTCATPPRTLWLAAGLTVHAVAELLGHVDAALVLRLNGHALPREVATAGDRLEAWRGAQRG